MTSRLIDPRLMQSLTRDFLPQLVDLYPPVKARDGAGEETITFPVATHEDVECRLGPASGSERRRQNLKYVEITHKILMDGQYSGLTEEWQAQVGGVSYDIQNIAMEAEEILTVLYCRIVR